MTQSIIILSDKSSGSTILQNQLAEHPDISHLEKTEHQGFETLYWLKATYMLRDHDDQNFFPKKQKYTRKEAREKLLELIKENCSDFDESDLSDIEIIDKGWEALSKKSASVFIEKSPHHLPHRAVIDVMLESLKRQKQDFLIIGLIRHPMAVLYSSWERWHSSPQRAQWRWYYCAKNLDYLAQSLPKENFILIKYEDLTTAPDTHMTKVYQKCGVNMPSSDVLCHKIHRKSVSKWSEKKASLIKIGPFKFIRRDFSKMVSLDPKVKEMAQKYGYDV